ncbi:MAG: hypothetical protein ABH869_04440 [Candidatus Omnitrophota bacterium]
MPEIACMKKWRSVSLLLVLLKLSLLLLSISCYAQDKVTDTDSCLVSADEWQEMVNLGHEKILCMVRDNADKTLYLGTEKGLYKSECFGENWDEIDLVDGIFGIKDIEITSDNILALGRSGVWKIEKKNSNKELLIDKKNIKGIEVYLDNNNEEILICWTENSLFRGMDGLLTLIGPLNVDFIDDVYCYDGNMYLVSGKELYWSVNNGNTWDNMSIAGGSIGVEDEDTAQREDDEDAEIVSFVKDIGFMDERRMIIVTAKGVLVLSKDTEAGFQKDPNFVLLTGEAHDVVCIEDDIFILKDEGVFFCSPKNDLKAELMFRNSIPGQMSFIKKFKDHKDWLWLAVGGCLYRREINNLRSDYTVKNNNKYTHEDVDVVFGIKELHEMAIEYAELAPEKIKNWRRRAEWKAIMPQVDLKFSESTDDNVEIYKSSTSTYVVTGPQEKGSDWSIDFSWDLSDLIWSGDDTSIDVRSRLMVQLRNDILEDVTRLYFERKRLLIEISEMKRAYEEGTPGVAEKIIEKKFRVQETSAYLDALTGGRFTCMQQTSD